MTQVNILVHPHAKNPTANYPTVDSEMIVRTPHDQYVYAADNRILWHTLHDVSKDHPAYTSIRC